jgi:hypothetical protein
LAEITLAGERGQGLVGAEFDHAEGPLDYVSPELLERWETPR